MPHLTQITGALLLASLFCPLARSQQVLDLTPTEGSVGTVVRVFVDDVPKKPKPVLAQDGKLVKKTKLKVVGTGADFIDVSVAKAPAGSFQVGFKAKGGSAAGTGSTPFEVRAPRVDAVDPGSGGPGDSVDVLVAFAGAGKLSAQVGSAKAKVTDVVPFGGDGAGGPLSMVSLLVPKKLPNGVWPVTISNAVGSGSLKSALEVVGSQAKPTKPGAVFDISGEKPLKVKSKLLSYDDDTLAFQVVAIGGSKKKPRTVTIDIPKPIDEVQAGDSFGPGTEGANIVYAGQGDDAPSAWFADAGPSIEPCGEWGIDVVSVVDGVISFALCGCLVRVTGDGPQTLELFGNLTFDSNVEIDTGGGQPCPETMTAMGSVTGAFVSDDVTPSAWYGLTGPTILLIGAATPEVFPPGGGAPYPEQTVAINVDFDPSVDATPVTLDSLALLGPGIQNFTLELYDGENIEFWTMGIDPQTFATSISVTIESVETKPSNPLHVLGCIKGSYTGTLNRTTDQAVQTFTGQFELPWYDQTFGGGL